MSLGIVCDGTAEAVALHGLVQRFNGSQRILRPVYADMQPFAPAAQIVRAAIPKIELLQDRGARSFVVLLDRENQAQCPGVLSEALMTEFRKVGFEVTVVYKDRAFENWLISDPESIQAHFPKVAIGKRITDRIISSGADSVSAYTLLNDCVRGGYSKRRDAIKFCQVLNPAVAKRNSRSFRKFAKHCGC